MGKSKQKIKPEKKKGGRLKLFFIVFSIIVVLSAIGKSTKQKQTQAPSVLVAQKAQKIQKPSEVTQATKATEKKVDEHVISGAFGLKLGEKLNKNHISMDASSLGDGIFLMNAPNPIETFKDYSVITSPDRIIYLIKGEKEHREIRLCVQAIEPVVSTLEKKYGKKMPKVENGSSISYSLEIKERFIGVSCTKKTKGSQANIAYIDGKTMEEAKVAWKKQKEENIKVDSL